MTGVERALAGWGNFPVETCFVSRPETIDALRRVVVEGEAPDYISRGLGRSYGDSATNLGRGVIDQTRLDRLLAFDDATGVLDCEAGVSFAEIIRLFLPRGFFLPTTPGTKFVTLGGAIAADVHGKNHHVDGSFGEFVEHLDLMIASGEIVRCSRTERPELFWATVGGMGLTGVIVSARIRLMRVESAYWDVEYRRCPDLDAALAAMRDTNAEFRYSVAWIDCLSAGRKLGRSVLMLGHDGKAEALPRKLRRRPLSPPSKPEALVPFDFPGFALNPFSVQAFNTVFYAANRDKRAFVDYDTYFYPLDAVHHWNRIYGRRGFLQYQALLPPETTRDGLIALLERITRDQRASFLAVLKTCGAAGGGMLSYLYPGHTLALDFPYTGPDVLEFTQALDRILLDHGGRLYLAKDTVMSADTFRRMYPRLDEFKAVKDAVDPNRRFVSSQARRVGIV
jgi:decaprenylphospho-beta-D-ribofuranose 2-oxidase